MIISIPAETNPETVRTAMSKEKTRIEESLKAFEIPVENTRLHFKYQKKNGTYKVWISELRPDFQILLDPPSEE